MRFDDKLDTAIAQPADDAAAIAVAWCQIVDILAQSRGDQSAEQRHEAFGRLLLWRHKVSADRRRASARSLIGRNIPADLVGFFGSDTPQVAAPLLLSANLSEGDWLALLPGFAPPSRALVRERRDLPAGVQAALNSFGPSDLALGGEVDASAPDNVGVQISDLVARIEAFKKDREDNPAPKPGRATDPEEAPDGFRFETGADGIVNWVEGAPRGPIIGIEIATMAEVGAHGVDGHAAGAFRRRTPFRNARMLVPGEGLVAGEWLISGLPGFNERDGRFVGYRCTARRPERDERPISQNLTVFGNALPPDSVRQLVHELRTPLNAIRGFAEMIQGQLLGPVSAAYRQRAENIISEAVKLLALFEDLDVAAKLERGALEIRSTSATDVNHVLQSIADTFVALTNARQVHLRFATSPNLPGVAIDAVTVERMISRMLGAVIGLSRQGETINAHVVSDRRAVQFSVDRPLSLTGQSERELYDPVYSPEGDWPDAPSLGLGFTLRLVANMARAAKGRLAIGEDRFVLFLPVEGDVAGTTLTSS